MNPNSKTIGTIFIIEDNPGDVYLIKEALRQEGCQFSPVTFDDGEQAMSHLRLLVDSESAILPSLVLLDMNLPRVDGSQLLSFIRGSLKLSRVPVVVLSSSPEDLMSERLPKASGYIRKPNNLDDFLRIGDRIVSYWQQAL